MRFFIAGWMTLSSLIILNDDSLVLWNQSSDYSLFLFEFLETGTNHSSMFNIGNYKIIKQDGTPLRLDSIAKVFFIDDGFGGIVPEFSTIAAIKTEKVKPKTAYKIIVTNIYNNSGTVSVTDTSYYYFPGFYPNLIQTPEINFNK
jgi:hypothetical protein